MLKTAQWPENLKAVRSASAWSGARLVGRRRPTATAALERAFGGSIGRGNMARFKLEAFDEIYQRMKMLPSGPERQKLFDKSQRSS